MTPLLLLLAACTGPAGKDDTADSGAPPDSGDTADSSDTADSGDTGDTGDSGDAVSEEDRAAIQRKLDNVLSRQGASGAQLAVWRDGEIILTLVSGVTEEGGSTPVTDDTLFQCGSDTKKMVAITALQQVAAGRLSLDADVATTLGGYSLTATPEWAGDATVDLLLSHQGGLYDYTPWNDDPDDAALAARTWGIVADREWAHSPPGAMWNYSNPNFSFAGLLVETVDGRPWPQVVEEDVFAPLGMTRSYARLSEVLAESDVASGYGYSMPDRDWFDLYAEFEYTVGVVTPAEHVDNAFTRPAGLVWTTASDLARLGGFLIDGDDAVLADDLRAEITTEHVPFYPTYPYLHYGYGMMIQRGITLTDGYHDVPLWVHGGNTLTQTSLTLMVPEHRFVVQILTNGYGNDMSTVAVTVLDRLGRLGAADTPPELVPTETDHARLAGTYYDPGIGPITVFDDDGALMVDIPFFEDLGAANPTTLALNWDDLYLDSALGLDFTFIQDEAGDYRWIRNRLFVGTRADDRARTAAPAPRLTPAQFEAARLAADAERLPLPGDALRPAGAPR